MTPIIALPSNPFFHHLTDQRMSASPEPVFYERGFAKINLSLHVFEQAANGYHRLSSLVAFTRFGDHLYFRPYQDSASPFTLSISGDHSTMLASEPSNHVLQAAAAFKRLVPQTPSGHFHLHKRIPIAAGLGGGTADAGAALRLLGRMMALARTDSRLMEAARAVGADAPACLYAKPLIMAGFGEEITPMPDLPKLYCLLVNPRQALSTASVFKALAQSRKQMRESPTHYYKDQFRQDLSYNSSQEFLEALATTHNDLTAPAISLLPVLSDMLDALQATKNCTLARMSGSGASCFGLYKTRLDLRNARQALQAAHPEWWMMASVLW